MTQTEQDPRLAPPAMHPPMQPPMYIFSLLGGIQFARALHVAAQLKIPDLLKAGPQQVDYLARATETNADALYRVLRALASLHIFAEMEGKTFALTDISDYLREDHPSCLRDTVLMMLAPWGWATWGNFEYSVRTGKPAFDDVYGMNVWSYMQQHPEEYHLFNKTMISISNATNEAIANAYDFSRFQTLMDVGGGTGSLLIAILKQNPSLRGILLETPSAIADASEYVKREGLETRMTLRAGNFFDNIAASADCYLFKHVLHDWGDDQACVRILRNCRAAAPTGAKILLAEQVLPDNNASQTATATDLEMMAKTGGRERTQTELRSLLETAGFTFERLIPTMSFDSIVEASLFQS